jgi:hypothetical protein
MIRQIETVAHVGADHSVMVRAPDDVPPGPCRMTIVFRPDEPGVAPGVGRFTDGWPVHDVALVDPTETFRRESMYGDGR